MIDLASLYPSMESIIAFKLEELSQAKINEIGPICEELSILYRAAGIAAILLELDSDQFYHMLIRSGLTRLFLLQKVSPDNKEGSRYCKITRANGFFDSVAANRLDLAKQIAIRSPQRWIETYEYEDDYCYILFLHEMVKGGERRLKEGILDRFKRVLEGQKPPRYLICCALLEGDSDHFDNAFLDLLDQRTEEMEFQKRSLSRNEVEFATARHLYVEGLALLMIAEMAGIRTRKEYYPYCPSEARVPMQTPFPGDACL